MTTKERIESADITQDGWEEEIYATIEDLEFRGWVKGHMGQFNGVLSYSSEDFREELLDAVGLSLTDETQAPDAPGDTLQAFKDAFDASLAATPDAEIVASFEAMGCPVEVVAPAEGTPEVDEEAFTIRQWQDGNADGCEEDTELVTAHLARALELSRNDWQRRARRATDSAFRWEEAAHAMERRALAAEAREESAWTNRNHFCREVNIIGKEIVGPRIDCFKGDCCSPEAVTRETRNLVEGLEQERDRLRAALEEISRQRNNRYESTVGVVCNIADAALTQPAP